MIRNLGKVLTILAMADATEMDKHLDIDVFGGPGECHRDVERGEAQRRRQARRHAVATARRPYRAIMLEAKRRGLTPPRFERLVHACRRHPCR
jgi:hypothetical protein